MEQQWFVNSNADTPVSEEAITEMLQHGCVGMAIRIGRGKEIDPVALETIEMAKIMQIPFSLYLIADMEETPGSQVKILQEWIEEHAPNSAMIMVDQWWMKWNEYAEHLKSGKYVRSFSSEALLRYYNEIFIKIKGLPGVGLASNNDFVNGHCRRFAAQINDSKIYWHIGTLNVFNIKMPAMTFDQLEDTLSKIKWPLKELPYGVRKFDGWEFMNVSVDGFGSFGISGLSDKGVEVMFGVAPEPKKKATKRKSGGKKKAELNISEETFAGKDTPEHEPEPEEFPEAPEEFKGEEGELHSMSFHIAYDEDGEDKEEA